MYRTNFPEQLGFVTPNGYNVYDLSSEEDINYQRQLLQETFNPVNINDRSFMINGEYCINGEYSQSDDMFQSGGAAKKSKSKKPAKKGKSKGGAGRRHRYRGGEHTEECRRCDTCTC